MEDNSKSVLRDLLEKLVDDPGDNEIWMKTSEVMNEESKDMFLEHLKGYPGVLKAFFNLIQLDPKISENFFLTLEDVDRLESLLRGPTPSPGEDTSEEESPSITAEPDKSVFIKDIDDQLADILGEEKEEPLATSEFDDVLSELSDEKTSDEKDKEYKDLIKQASDKLFSFDQEVISEAIKLYEEALLINAENAIDWYNLGQSYLKRAQKTAGIFSYSFEGHYKDLSDFYKSLSATKRAVELALDDKFYWQNLATIYELMGKKPMALFCIRKSLEIFKTQKERVTGSELLDSGSIEDDQLNQLKDKYENLASQVEGEVDPFDDAAVFQFESEARKLKIEKDKPLDHHELYLEAVEQYDNGEIEKSRNYLNKSIELKEDFFEAWLTLAEINTVVAMNTGDDELQVIEFSDANRCLERAKKIEPNSIEPLKIYAMQYEFLDNRDDYIKTIAKIVEFEPDNWKYRKTLGEVYFEKGLNFHIYADATAADIYMRKSIDMYPYDGSIWLWYGKNFILRKEYDNAINALLESQRLTGENDAVIEALKQAHYEKAKKFKNENKYEEALASIADIFEIDPENGLATELQYEIVDDYCQFGFSDIEENKLENARENFEKALTIDAKYPFAWFGMAQYHFLSDHLDEGLTATINTMVEWNLDINKYSDQFIIEGALDIFPYMVKASHQYNDKIVRVCEEFKQLLGSFMDINELIHNDHIKHGTIYKRILDFFFVIAVQIIENSDENLKKLLEFFDASELPAHVKIIGNWENTRGIDDKVIIENRILILKDLEFFIQRLFNMLLFKCNNKDIDNIIIFLNYIIQELNITIKEIYEIFKFIENGEVLIKILDILATTIHVDTIEICLDEFPIIKAHKNISLIRPHPILDLHAVIYKDQKVSITDQGFSPQKSIIFTGKAAKIKPDDIQWSKDGFKLCAVENNFEKKKLRVTSINLSLDPLVNKEAEAVEIDQELLEAQIFQKELEGNALIINWKEKEAFQLLLDNGIMIGWFLTGSLYRKESDYLSIDQDHLHALSQDQRKFALINRSKKALILLNLETVESFSYELSPEKMPLALEWDNTSKMVHVLSKGNDNDEYCLEKIYPGSPIELVGEFEEFDLTVELFRALNAGDHVLYFLYTESQIIVYDDSFSMRMEFPVDEKFQALLGKGILNVFWFKKNEIWISVNDSKIINLDLTGSMRVMLENRVKFLSRFPRDTFMKKVNLLKSLLNSL
ncbi:MAG: tetratricopeptide repeat protein [Candidatus Hodarchaeota archaeon]